MTNIKVKYLFIFRELLGKSEDILSLDNPTIEKVLEELFRIYGGGFKQRVVDPDTNQVRFASTQPRSILFYPKKGHSRRDSLKAVRILLNGRHIFHYKGVDTELKEGDVITIF